MSLLGKIKKWPAERKRFFSLFLALFLTVLIIILNIFINSIWVSKNGVNLGKNNGIDTIKESFSNIIDQNKPILDQALNSFKNAMPTTTDEAVDQINSASSSFATSSDIVE